MNSLQNLSFTFHCPYKEGLETFVDVFDIQDFRTLTFVLFPKNIVNFYAYTTFGFHKPLKEA